MQVSGYRKFKSGFEIRGIASDHDSVKAELTPTVIERIAYAYAGWLADELETTTDKLSIAVGRDTRSSSMSLMQAVVRALTAADCDVIDCGVCTTPAMALTVVNDSIGSDGSIMVTGSHCEWFINGLKLMTRKGGVSEQDISKILSKAEVVCPTPRLITPINLLGLYKEGLRKLVESNMPDGDMQTPLFGLHVIVDASCGSGGFYAEWLNEMGCDTTGSVNLDEDGRFLAHEPNPENTAAINQVISIVRENDADMGIIFDADCDRVATVDRHGNIFSSNRLIALISAILLNEKPGSTIVTDSVTSSGLQRFITEWGGIHYRFKRGHRNVINEAIRLNKEGIDCPLAIETTGHAAFRDNHFIDDGMYLVTRLLCEAVRLKKDGLTLASLLDGLLEPVERTEIRLPVDADDERGAMQAIFSAVIANTLVDKKWHMANDNREGVRIVFDLEGDVANAWFQLRPSLHEASLVVNAESDVAGGITGILGQLYDLIKDDENLDLNPLIKAIR